MFEPIKGKVHLTVKADQPYDEIFLIDAGFKRVAAGIGTLDLPRLDPGLYKLKFKVGENIVEERLLLNEPRVERVGPRVELASSAAPALRRDFHPGAFLAMRGDRLPKAKAGVPPKTRLRQFGKTPRMRTGRLDIAVAREGLQTAPLRILNPDGRSSVQPRETTHLRCQAGCYRVHVDLGNLPPIEMAVWVIAGFRTSVFLETREFGVSEPAVRPDLTRAAITTSRTSASSAVPDAVLYATEQARLSLESRRAVIPHSQIERMAIAKWHDPMRGILAAHLLLLEPSLDIRLFDEVTRNLARIAPAVPDVVILRLWADKLTKRTPRQKAALPDPPMLEPSYRLLADPWMTQHTDVPPGSLCAGAVANLWGQSIWMVWRSFERPGAAKARKQAREPRKRKKRKT